MIASKQFRVTLGLCILCVIVIAYVHPLISAYADTVEATMEISPTATEVTPVPDTSIPQPPEAGGPSSPVSAPVVSVEATALPLPTASLMPSATIPPAAPATFVPEASPSAEIATVEATALSSPTTSLMPGATIPPAVSATVAAEASLGEETATVEATTLSSPTASLMPGATIPPAAPATLVPEASLGEETATVEATTLPLPSPSATMMPVGVEMTPIAEQVTGEPIMPTPDVIQLTVTATLPAPPASVRAIILVPNEVQVSADATLTLTVFADGLESIYSVVLICQVDPAMLSGVETRAGEMLPPEQVTTMDGGFEADGRWTLAATYDNIVSAGLQGTGILWQLDYRADAQALARIQCQAQMSDQDGHPLPPVMAETILVIEDRPAEATIPLATETLVVETAAPSPTTELTPTLTPSPTQEETATAEATTDAVEIPSSIAPELVAQSYGLTVPPADPALDLNGDGIININDLVLASARVTTEQ